MAGSKLLSLMPLVMLLSLTLVIFTPSSLAQTSNEKYNPSLKVIPGSGPAGTEVSIFGTGYPPNAHILLKIGWASGTYEEDTNAAGSFSFDTAAPDVKPGTYEIYAANLKTIYTPDAEFKTSTIYISADSSFTITEKKIASSHTKPGATGKTIPNPPTPPQPPTTPTSSANGGGLSSSFFTIDPTSGPPGTTVSLKGGGFTGSILAVFMGGTRLGNGIVHSTGGDSISGSVTIPNSAQPGPITISVESSDFTGIAVFTVTGNAKAVLHTVPANTLKAPPTNNPQYNVPANNGKLTLPTTPGKSTISSKPTTPTKPTLPTAKPTGILTPKTPSVSSCPKGSFAISGKCVSKGAVIAILQ